MNSKKTLILSFELNNSIQKISKNELFRNINNSNVVEGQFHVKFGSKHFTLFKRTDNEFGIEPNPNWYTDSKDIINTNLKGLHKFIRNLKRNTKVEWESC